MYLYAKKSRIRILVSGVRDVLYAKFYWRCESTISKKLSILIVALQVKYPGICPLAKMYSTHCKNIIKLIKA